MNTKKTIPYYFSQAGAFAVIATCFFIPFSTAYIALFSVLAVLFWVLSGKFMELPQILKNSPVSLVAFLLFLLFVIGIAYSPANLLDSLSNLKKYRELIFFPIVISLLSDKPWARVAAEYSFIAGCIVLMLVSFGMSLSLITSHRFGDSLVYHITHSFFMAILIYWSAQRATESRQDRYFWLFTGAVALANLTFLAPGRIGMLVLICLAVLYTVQHFSLKMQLIGFMLLATASTTLYLSSGNVSQRINEAINEIQTYEQGSARTSMGMRLDWYNDCLVLFKEKPVFGHGTGGFEVAHDKLIEGTTIKHTGNPHNEYLFIAVQLGAVGLALFLLLLAAMLSASFKLARPDRWMLQGIVVSMAVGCTLNSFLYDSQQGHYFVFLSSVFLATSRKNSLTRQVKISSDYHANSAANK
ncbi:MAG: O-antigen ligase family protein [Deltaproteobacteria bacterium]|nr:O-antigen ligase family protein [Deltaproteobacteria bacterium]